MKAVIAASQLIVEEQYSDMLPCASGSRRQTLQLRRPLSPSLWQRTTTSSVPSRPRTSTSLVTLVDRLQTQPPGTILRGTSADPRVVRQHWHSSAEVGAHLRRDHEQARYTGFRHHDADIADQDQTPLLIYMQSCSRSCGIMTACWRNGCQGVQPAQSLGGYHSLFHLANPQFLIPR